MAFHQVAVPHQDILSDNYSSEVYAAKLWDVHKKRGSDVYIDANTFFEKTYLTDNLKNILDSVKERLDGKKGGHFRSITTPFGGGKTHTLIALYHKCSEWGVKPVVLVGNELDPKTQTLWGLIEEQLTGKIDRLEGQIPRGGEALRNVLESQNSPILILIDELLQYVTRADGVRINDTTLATQTIAFMQELSEVASSIPNVCVVVTLPSSANEQLDDAKFAKLYDKLNKVAGRMKDTITPVSDTDIPRIIRRRLFSSTDEQIRERAEGIVKDFVDYCRDENLIPEGMQPSEYRERFLSSYPFLPQVIDVLYQRWGTITQFQRTRGVLRLLSLVVGSLATSDKQFIGLGDFDLTNDAIRQELVGYLEPQFNGIVAKDIVEKSSGASKADRKMPDQFKGKRLGVRAATAIFMYSHSGGAEINGAMEAEIKRATCERGIPAAQINEVLSLLRSNLFYLNTVNDRYLFTKEANIIKIKMDRLDNLKQRDIDEAERDLLKHSISKTHQLRTVMWPEDSKKVEDSKNIKLVIMRSNDLEEIGHIHNRVGESDRTYRNNIFFLAPSDGEKEKFLQPLRNKVAWENIRDDPHISLKDEQKTELATELKKEDGNLARRLREYYSVLHVPEKDGFNTHQIIPPLETDMKIDKIIYDSLLEKEEIDEKIGLIRLKTDYLKDNGHVETSNVLNSMLSTPGELRPTSKDVLEKTIVDGVLSGEFGLGVMENEKLRVRFFKKSPTVSFDPGELLIQASLCNEQESSNNGFIGTTSTDSNGLADQDEEKPEGGTQQPTPMSQSYLEVTFDVPEGQVNQISNMLLNIARHYSKLQLHIKASDGKMSKHDIDMIKETLSQIGAKHDLE